MGDLVREELTKKGITILKEIDISGEEIDSKKLIDQHCYAIASKATILPAKDIPVPADKFKAEFGEEWDKVLSEGRAVNAMDACAKFGCDASALNDAWGNAKVTKFGGKDASIHCYVVEWDASTLSWADFRGKVLGPTDPSDAPAGAIRKLILDSYKELGLTSSPNKGDNG